MYFLKVIIQSFQIVLYLILVFLLFKNCQVKDNELQKREIIKGYVQSYNDFDVDNMIKHLHKDVIFENYSDGQLSHRTEGIEVFKKQALSAKEYFISREQKIQVWQFKDKQVKINIDYQAILATDLPNGMKKGDTLNLKGTSIFDFQDGEISKIVDES